MKIALGGDHAGFEYKKVIIELLDSQGIESEDFGPFSSESCDYPDFVHPVAEAIEIGKFNLGIIICGSGNGVAMTVNKHQNIRCALAWEPELAALARAHNDANIISIPARYVSLEKAKQIVSVFLSTEFEGGRHQNRVSKIPCV
ncbi:ribose 5-phosphate isomerase B [Sinobacterium caligoides]|uniref:Ribose 5-phosphate isomerase B n=1 Tax=Sinobacterium caligoides TaxID=933926 RepID=A0A3N2DEZ9_9GAMM|nr:ribose 5-phosphate isomerase B [Sinobacterium caligoides]ROR98004.1 ribose 5-phosphate isomerase B [Sinobacterium caligoides]